MGNPLIGGNTSGNWEGHYIYFGWEGLDSNKYNGNDNWLEIKDYVNNNDFYRLNGQLYSGADLMTPIKWRILNNNGSALLLLSDEMLDVYNYGTVSNDHPTWETSDIRHWLDTEFMKNHFTSEEQADIKESKVTDIVAADSNLPEGNTTNDRIFLPSKEELVDEDYGFPVKGESPSRKTTYNNDSLKDRNTAGDRSYWTRSRGDLNYTFLRPFFVTEKGLCGYGANRYCSWILGVRPMLRLDLDSQRYGFNKTDDNLSAGIKFNKSTLEMNVGDIKDLEVIPINIADNLTSLKWISTNPSVVSLGVDGKLSAMSNGTANIYAIHDQYVAQCRITVKENPKQQYKVIFKDGDTIVREIMVEEYTAATAPTLTKDGYTLTWDKDFSNITEDIIINAIWTGNTYNIIYEMNNGTNHSFNPRTYTTGVGAVFQRPTYAGHTFGGWYTTPDFKEGTGIILIAPNQIGDITVYAKWNVADYKITYNLFGGTNHKSNPDSYTFGIGVTLKDPTANGSIFKGWYTTSDFKEGTSITSIDSKTSGDITLYAKWELRTCDIAYVLNGGVNHVSNPTKYTYGEGAIFENPTYSGHIFEGWYLTPDFRNGTNITFLNLNNTGDVTVYAKWKKGNSQSGSGSHGSSGGGSTGGHSGVVSGPSIKDDTYINSIWEQAANGWKLKKQDGKFAIGWVYKDKKWYYFDKDGIMCTGWLDLSGKKYFLFEGTGSLVGAMAEHEWCCIDNRYYYFNENGELIRNLSNEEWINEGYSKSKFFYQRDPEWVAKVKSINPSLDPWVHQACYLCVLSMVINNLGYTDVDPAILYLKNNEDTNIHQDIIKNNFNNEFSETRIKDMSDDEYKHVLYDFLTGGNETGRNNENKLYTQGVVIVYEKGKHYSLAVGAYRRSDSTIVIMVNDPGMEGEEHFINFEESYPRNSEKWIIGALEMWEKR